MTEPLFLNLPLEEIRLTQTVQKGGCAAKLAAAELRRLLQQVEFPPAPADLLIDGRNFDDASVQRLTPDLALVSTLDFFTPIVDSPRAFGAIAATNALSDVYAMGGQPITALGILAFPVATLPEQVLIEVMQGACDQLKLASVSLSGGHSIDDDTLKFGLSVSGLVHPEKIWSNAGARDGDVLILTKALGTGTISAAMKRGALSEKIDEQAQVMRTAIASMCQLNDAVRPLEATGLRDAVHAATDITGFGFAGHAWNLAKSSGVRLLIDAGSLPVLPGALQSLRDGFLTKAHRSNKSYVGEHFEATGLDPITELLMMDPQTSGGLLLSVAADRAEKVLQVLRSQFAVATRVGTVQAHTEPKLVIRA